MIVRRLESNRGEPRHGALRFGLLLLIAGSCPRSTAQIQPISPATPGGQTSPQIATVPPRPMEDVVARTRLGNITIQMLTDFYVAYRVPVRPAVPSNRVAEMPAAWLEEVARSLAVGIAADSRVKAITDPEERRPFEDTFDTYVLNLAIQEIFKRQVEARIVEPSEAVIAQYYEDRKPAYYQPLQFYMRYIFMMSYERYTVQPGDDLESIAQRVAGDRSKVDKILSDVDARPVRWVPQEERTERLFKPLEVGENLLVPMNSEKAEEVRRALNQVRAKLGEGESFESLAATYSEAEAEGAVVGPLPSGVRRMHAELLQAALETPIGGVSEVFRTKDGFYVIQVTDRIDEGYKPLATVRESIVDTILKDQEERLTRLLYDDLYSMEELEILQDVLASAPDIDASAVVIRVGPSGFTWEEFQSMYELAGGANPDPARILAAVKAFQPVQDALMLAWARRNNIFEDPVLGRIHAAMRAGVMSMSYLSSEAEKAARATIDEEAVTQYYDSRKNDQYSLPARVSYQVIERAPAQGFFALSAGDRRKELDRLASDLDRDLETVLSISSFNELAARTNIVTAVRPNPNASPIAATDLDVSLLLGATRDEIKALEPGSWSKAYSEEVTVRAVGVTARSEARIRALDEVREEIESRLLTRALPPIQSEIRAKWLEEVEYEFLLPLGP